MDKEKELPQRKRLRLKNFDYSTPGAYFITVCTHNRKCTLSRVVVAIHESPELQLTEYGKIIDRLALRKSNTIASEPKNAEPLSDLCLEGFLTSCTKARTNPLPFLGSEVIRSFKRANRLDYKAKKCRQLKNCQAFSTQ